MLHLIIIALFVIVAMHDSFAAAGLSPDGKGAGWWVWAASLGPMAALAGATVLVVGVLARDVERRGAGRSVVLADRMLDVSRWAALLIHACNVLVIGWLGAVRGVFGDIIAVDELVAITPPLLVFLAGWWAYYPIERAMRDATTLRVMETGAPMYPLVTRWQYLVLNIRHQVMLSLVPIAMIAAWSEGVERGIAWLARRADHEGWVGTIGGWLASESDRAAATIVLQLVGVAVVFTLSPLVLKRVWDTVRLGPGPIHDRLMELCTASGVRVRGLLVWRTHGTMLNGAVIGLIGPLRYILLTDALLDHLPERQVEAVMAHEVGHAKHAHMPWLAASMFAGVSGAAIILGLGAWALLNLVGFAGHPRLAEAIGGSYALSGVMLAGSFIAGMSWFGFVSRRFEWQADAFAVQQISRVMNEHEPTLWEALPAVDTGETAARSPLPRGGIRPEAIEAMTTALDTVADLNHLSRTRFTWRHGSIAQRQRKLRALKGRAIGSLPIDRTARWLKRAMAAAIILLIAVAVLERRAERGRDPEDPRQRIELWGEHR